MTIWQNHNWGQFYAEDHFGTVARKARNYSISPPVVGQNFYLAPLHDFTIEK